MPRPPSRFSGSPVVKWLLISNIVIFYADMLFFNWKLVEWGHFSAALGLQQFQFWRLLTFQFMHADGLHLLGNMIGIFFFGTFAEKWWGSKKFIVYYLASGVAGALFYVFLFYVGWFGKDPIAIPGGEVPASYIPLVGASAGIFAILVCTAVIAPNLKILLFFVIPMSMRTFAIAALVFATLMILTNGNNAGGEAGHLGGAILGYILMKNPHLLTFVGKLGSKKQKRGQVVDAKIVRERKLKPRIKINLEDSDVDQILDKVSREGIQSLTDAEREILNRSRS
ncbi:rhomboid family intramembrane serine protease [Oceaniferula spumae]|uniref:Rhomboid family intramembrane serine protease n=1 Tax=Oceaniferula spumae TaxID=2979115 RepID=A0AAT9FQZ6_9BACT